GVHTLRGFRGPAAMRLGTGAAELRAPRNPGSPSVRAHLPDLVRAFEPRHHALLVAPGIASVPRPLRLSDGGRGERAVGPMCPDPRDRKPDSHQFGKW